VSSFNELYIVQLQAKLVMEISSTVPYNKHIFKSSLLKGCESKMDFLYELEDSGYDIKQLVWNNNFYLLPVGTTSCTRSGWLRHTGSPSGTWAGGARLGNNGSLKN
jgi:hypothetical protein